MAVEDPIVRNLRYLIAEVIRQVDDAYRALENHDLDLARKVEERDDYIDLLKYSIARLAFGFEDAVEDMEADRRRAMFIVAASLEHIGDLAVNQANQVRFLNCKSYNLETFHINKFYNVVRKSLDRLLPAITKGKDRTIQQICNSEARLDKMYADNLARIVGYMKDPTQNHSGLLTFVFILKLYERMGDELLNIGEALLQQGGKERLKFHQWKVFQDVIESSTGLDRNSPSYRFEDILGTRSGHRIASVESEDKSAIFKEGFSRKIEEELEKIKMWNSRFPSLVPQILNVEKQGERAAIVIEYIDGVLLQDVIVNEPDSRLVEVMNVFLAEVRKIWEATMQRQRVESSAISQIRSRLPAVFAMHPQFQQLRSKRLSIGNISKPKLTSILDRLDKHKQKWPSPVSVWIHGDFNTNNIIYSHKNRSIHYIDVHRSRPGDPAEDVAVFMLSNIRLPLSDPVLRSRFAIINRAMLSMFRNFAESVEDEFAERRLALSVAKNYIGSSRFEIDRDRAEEFFLRGVGILDELLSSLRSRNYALDFVWLDM